MLSRRIIKGRIVMLPASLRQRLIEQAAEHANLIDGRGGERFYIYASSAQGSVKIADNIVVPTQTLP